MRPENTEAPDRTPVPGGYIEREPGESEEAFGRRADGIRLAALEDERRQADAEHRMSWREHMARCYSTPLGERPVAPEHGFRGTNARRHPWFTGEQAPMDPLPEGCRVTGPAASDPPRRMRCPDEGLCHHGCPADGGCFRVIYAQPLTAAGFGDAWPQDLKAEHLQVARLNGTGTL